MNFLSQDFARRLKDLSPDYLQFLASHPSDSAIGEVVVLYGHEQIEERNDTHEVVKHVPDYICIGNDSGDNEFLLKRDGNATVYWKDPGCFNNPAFELIHPTFQIWVEGGCPLPKVPESPIPLQGIVWLLSTPPAGIKDMFRLKAMLGETWSVPQMKEYLAHTPVILRRQRYIYAVHRLLRQYPDLRDFLGFSEKEESEKKCYNRFSDEL